MTNVTLEGSLLPADAAEAAIIAKFLPAHIELSRAEPGCLSFSIEPTDDPLVWAVSERFVDTPAFRAHQARGAASDWGVATAAIERSFTIAGLDD